VYLTNETLPWVGGTLAAVVVALLIWYMVDVVLWLHGLAAKVDADSELEDSLVDASDGPSRTALATWADERAVQVTLLPVPEGWRVLAVEGG
jgi:hypothetical protein